MDLKGTEFIGSITLSGFVKEGDTISGGIIPDRADVLDIKTSEKIGRLLPDGTALDLLSRYLGRLRMPGGEIVNKDGRVVGKIFVGMRQVIGPNGEILGVVMPDGTVVDASGRVIGKADLNGKVVDASGRVIGEVIPVGQPIIGPDGKIIGYVGIDGQIVDKDGNPVLGPDGKPLRYRAGGSVVEDGGKVIGKIGDTLERLVYDENGNVIGRVLPDGTVVDLNGNVIGKMLPDGTVVDLNGNVIGRAGPPERLVYDENGNLIGRVLADGTVVDLKGNVIGRVQPDGTVTALGSKVIGYTVKDGLGLNFKNEIIGKIDSSGQLKKAGSDKSLGVLQADDTITDSRNAIIGKGVVNAVPVGLQCQMLGSIDDRGQVIDTAGRQIGRLNFDRSLVNSSNSQIGLALGRESVINEPCKIIGQITAEGKAVDTKGAEIGCVDFEGLVKDKNGKRLGRIVQKGQIRGPDDQMIGRIVSTGEALGTEGNILGCFSVDGAVLDKNKKILGVAADMKYAVDDQGKVVAHILGGTYGVNPEGGSFVGTLNGRNLTGPDNKQAGVLVPAGRRVIAVDGKVIGTVLPRGRVHDDRGEEIGYVTSSMRVLTGDRKFLGRVVPIGEECKDGKNNVVGTVHFDGTIVDERKQVLGRLLASGQALDNAGAHLCMISLISTNDDGSLFPKGLIGKMVYGPDGKPLGVVGADGFIRDANGNIIGRVLPDGTVIDLNGNVIGKAYPKGAVFSPDGKFLGIVDADGYLRDENGNIIGRMLPDGTVVDLNGKAIGKAAPASQSKNVRIAVGRDGKFLGIVGDDGFVRDENGNIIGRVLPDGTVVDLNGNVIGSVIEGEPMRDENGNIIGVIMPDGRVVDLDGNVIGRINANGEIVDADGTVLGTWRGGKLTAMSDKLQQKRFAFGKDGKRIGMIMPDGTVVDENGNIIGRVDENGNVVDLDGNIIGTVTDPGSSVEQQGGKGGQKDDRVSIFGTFDPDNYRYRGKSLGTGGGTGKGERYDPARIKQLRALQMAYRRQIRPGRGIGIPSVEEDLMKTQKRSKSWADLGVMKNVSSYRVNMDNMILADKAIPAVLVRSIDTEQEDVPISAVVERNIYSESGRKIIIPAGSRIIGELSGSSAGQEVGSASKVEIEWTRLIRPDGAAFQFEEGGVSGDASGRAGVGAYMDRQLMKKYGLPVVQSTITSAILYAMATNDSAAVGSDGEVAMSGRQQAAEDARTRFSDTMQQIFDDIINETSQLKTRLFVPSGTRITVFAKSDLWLRSSLEDEDVDSNTKVDVLIDPHKNDKRNEINEAAGESSGLTDGSGANPNNQNVQNDPNNLQQQQQIYYNNYAGQAPQQQPQQQQLIDPNKNKQQPPAPPPVLLQEKKEEPVDPVPELF